MHSFSFTSARKYFYSAGELLESSTTRPRAKVTIKLRGNPRMQEMVVEQIRGSAEPGTFIKIVRGIEQGMTVEQIKVVADQNL